MKYTAGAASVKKIYNVQEGGMMATWIDFIRTNKGLALDAKLISRTLPLTITKAMSGEGRVSPLLLREQTELALPKQILSLGRSSN